MQIIETPLPGLLLVKPQFFEDDRGYFFESYQFPRYEEAAIDAVFVQDNESKSMRGVVRGLHYQVAPFAQAKLVRVVQGRVFDVAVDLRTGSPTFGHWFGVELDSESKNQMYIPRGFAHGFSVLSESAVFTYKCDNVYHKAAERSISAFDPMLNIDWKINPDEQIVSEKDRLAPQFEAAEYNFEFTK